MVPELRAVQAEVRATNQRLDDQAANVDRRFEHVDRHFEQVERHFEQVERRFGEVDRRFDAIHEEIMNLAKPVASIDGKLDVLLNHVVDFKESARMSVRVEHLEKRVSQILERVDQLPPAAQPA